tara:strand:- start:4262 stop:5503 length:1242 start_codon:yes stop_codon:yes gene_type:complete
MKKILFLSIFFLISVFIGYENPKLVEKPKNYIKFHLKNMNLIDNFAVDKNEINEIEKEKYKIEEKNKLIVEGNSYNLILNKKINFDGRTAGFFIDNLDKKKFEFDIFLQNGLNINNNTTKEIFLPNDISFDQNGGLKSIFEVNEKKFAITSNKNINCAYAVIYEIETKINLLKTKCLPDIKNVDFNGLGGAVIEKDNYIYLSIGAPEWDSKQISSLAQDEKYFYGKIIRIKKDYFINNSGGKPVIDIFTYGHKNPQGLTYSDKHFFSIEHGPQGGDEINLIIKGKNYGWPEVSYGTEYNNGKGYKKFDNKFEKPMFTFLPSIAPSSMSKCPGNLKKYYSNDICLMFLTLREMSLYVLLIDESKLNVISYEKFEIGERMRHFGKKENKLYEKNNVFFVSADGAGIFSATFDNFR